MSGQFHGKVKPMSRRNLGKEIARSGRGQGKVERQCQGKINALLKQNNWNHNHNDNLMGFDTIEINLVFDLFIDYIICDCIFNYIICDCLFDYIICDLIFVYIICNCIFDCIICDYWFDYMMLELLWVKLS